MIEIGIHEVNKNYGYKPVLRGVSFAVQQGEKVALVGKNGSGKTTLLHMITGQEAPDAGSVSVRRGARVGYVAQLPGGLYAGATVHGVLQGAFGPLHGMAEEMRALEARMANPAEDLDALYTQYTQLQNRFDAAGGYEMDEQYSRVSRGFGLQPLLQTPFANLSGGEKTVVQLAAGLLARPDILLLDEPTNHLDGATLYWFTGFLAAWRGTVLVVSHDRHFLNRVATKTVLLAGGGAEVYPGNYSKALALQKQALLRQFEEHKNRQRQIEAMQAAARRFRDWGARGDNPDMFKKAKMLERRIEVLRAAEAPQRPKQAPALTFEGRRTSKEMLRVENFTLAVPGRTLAQNVSFCLYGGEKLLLGGNNGSGKTTLLRAVLAGAPGVYLAPGAKPGYIPQEIVFENEGQSALAYCQKRLTLAEGEARGFLARYGFYGAEVAKRLGALSGGERMLLLFGCLVQGGANLLILDEPTNHIDIDTRERLEEALEGYGGTLLFVSHDVYFIDKIATRRLHLGPEGLRAAPAPGGG